MSIDVDIKYVSDELGADVIAAIIQERGRDVVFTVSLGLVLCPTCNGLDSFCPTCDGNERIHLKDTLTLPALVRWKEEGIRKYTPQGQYTEGDCTIITTYTKRDPDQEGIMYSGSEFLMNRVTSVVVDGTVLNVTKFRRVGKPLNRVYFVCNEDEHVDGTFRAS